MIIEILNETLQFPNRREAVPEIMQTAEQRLSLAGFYYSHFIADGTELYDELEIFLLDNINNVEKITIIGRTLKELADEILLSASDYLNRAVPAVEELAERFYQEADADCWHQLAQLLEGVEWLVNSFSIIDQKIAVNPYTQAYSGWNEYLQYIHSLKQALEELAQAMTNRDLVLIGDLLTYEVTDIFKKMKAKLQNILPWEE